jgi:tetratricopeptide (TPR) repeat protein
MRFLGNFFKPLLDRPSAFLMPFVLAVLVLGTFAPALYNDFVGYDDPVYVTGNPHVQRGLNLGDLAWAFSNSETGNWHPLTWISHMVDGALFGLRPWGHHLMSIVLHALSTLFLFHLLNRATGAAWRSFAVAALFGLHPLRVESVAWVAERKDVLNALFWMLSLGAYVRYAQAMAGRSGGMGETIGVGGIRRAGHPTLSYVSSLGFFILSLLSKPMSVTLPFVLFLVDYWPLTRWQRQSAKLLLIEKAPFLAGSLAMSAVTFLTQRSAGAVVASAPLYERFANAAISYCRYLGKLFWPVDLAVFYPPVGHWPAGAVLLAGLFLAAASVLIFGARRHRPFLLTGWFWFLGTLVPVIGLIQAGEQSMADRYSYIPSIGIFLAVTWALAEVLPARRAVAVSLTAATSLVLAGCVVVTLRQIQHWRESETLFRHALEVTRDNYLAHLNLGTALDKKGRLDEAVAELEQALKLKSNYPEALNNLGSILSKQGRQEDAMRYYRQALSLKPTYAEAHYNLGLALDAQGALDSALSEYEIAVQLKPDYADAHYNRGILLGRQGRLEEALREFQTTLHWQPGSADACNNLGTTFQKLGRMDEAIRYYKLALSLRPGFARAHFNLGVALATKERWDEAAGEFKRALDLKPDYLEAQKNLEAISALRQRGATRPPGQLH